MSYFNDAKLAKKSKNINAGFGGCSKYAPSLLAVK